MAVAPRVRMLPAPEEILLERMFADDSTAETADSDDRIPDEALALGGGSDPYLD